MSEILPRSRVIDVRFSVALPCDATREQILEWICFEVHHYGSMECDNPLGEYEVEAINEPVLIDSEVHLHEHVEFDRQEGDSTHYRMRKWLSPLPSSAPSSDEQIHEILKQRLEEKGR